MNRRHLFSLFAAMPIAACATSTGAPDYTQAVADVQAISGALAAEAPVILAAFKLSAATTAKITAILTDIQKNAAALSVASAPAVVAPTSIQTVISDVQTLAPIVLAAAGLPPQTVAAVNAAIALLPILSATIGKSSDTLAKPVYTPAQARSVLLASIAK